MPRTNNQAAYMSVEQAAAFWGLRPHAIRQRITDGTLPAVRLSSRCLRIRTEDVEAMGQPVQSGRAS